MASHQKNTKIELSDTNTNRLQLARKLRRLAKENGTLFAYRTKTLVAEYSVKELQNMLEQAEQAWRSREQQTFMGIRDLGE